MALNVPQRRTLGLALIASLCLHVGVGLSIFMPSGLFANTSHSSQFDDPSPPSGPDDQPEPPPPESRQPPRIRLGIERSSNATVTWLGFETPTEHEVTRESEVEQAALAPDTSGGQASGLPDALTMVPTPVSPPPAPPPAPVPDPAPDTEPPSQPNQQPTQQPTPQPAPEPNPEPAPQPVPAPAPAPTPQPEAPQPEEPPPLAPAPVTPPPAAPLREVLKIFAPESSTSEGPVAAPEPKLETLIDIDRPPRESTPDNAETTPPETTPPETKPSETKPSETKPTETQPSEVQPPVAPAAEPATSVQPQTVQPQTVQPQTVQPQTVQPQPPQPQSPQPETPPSLGPRPAPTTGLSESDADGRKVRQRLKSERESPAAALKRAVRFRPGQPAAVEGLDVRTVEPSFPTTLRFTSNPRNPVVVVNFNRRGRVVSATFLTDDRTKRIYDTGDPLIDNYLMTSLYLWTAKGKELDALPADNPEMVVSIVVEVTLR